MDYLIKSISALALCLIVCSGLAKTTLKVPSGDDGSHQIKVISDQVYGENDRKNDPLLISFKNDFYLKLLNHESTDLQAYAVLYWASGNQFNYLDKTIQKKVNLTIKNMLSIDRLSPQTLLFLQTVCDGSSAIPACDSDKVISRQLQNYPEDMSVYLLPIENAVNNDTEGELIDLMRKMANAKYLGLYMQYSEEFEMSLDAFIEENPLSDSVIERHVSDYIDYFHRSDDLSNEEVLQIKKSMPDYILHTLKIGMNMSYPSPPFEGVILACSNYRELKDSCLRVSETMYETSKQSIGKLIGLTIPVKVHELFGNQEKAEQAALRKEKFRDSYYCLIDSLIIPEILDSSYLLSGEVLNVEIQQGEWAAVQHKAKLIYQKALDYGYKNAAELNPELCFLD